MNSRMPMIAFVGDLTVDNYVKQNELHLGGSSLNGAMWAKRLGAVPSILAAVGTDEAGEEFIKKLQKNHIDARNVKRLRGSTSHIEIRTTASGEREYGDWQPGVLTSYHLDPKEFTWLRKQDAISLVVYEPTVHLLDELAADRRSHLRGKKPLAVVDFGDLSQFEKDSEFVEMYLDAFDIFLFGLDKEKDENLINRLQELSREFGKMVIITLNKYGAVASMGEDVYAYMGKQKRVVDGTGAGDAFGAGFLVSYVQTHSIDHALDAGCRMGGRAVTKIGAY